MNVASCKNHETFNKTCGDCRMARLVQLDREDSSCRCPVLNVGDYCPIHGG